MKLTKFPTDVEYRTAQEKTERMRRKRPFWVKGELERVAHHLSIYYGMQQSIAGVCHGARYGHEVKHLGELLLGYFETVDIVGTDLFPKNEYCIEHDFRVQKPEWVGALNFIYSNSLDHSDNPPETVKVWLEQLTPNGLLFIEWCRNHMSTSGGDCFGANLHEYIALLEEAGQLKDLIYVGTRYHVTLLVAKRKNT